MIQSLLQSVQHRNRRQQWPAQAAAIGANRLWMLLFSLKNSDTQRRNLEFSEQDDIQKSRQGDSEAYRRLVQRHQSHVGKLLWRFTRHTNDHEELVQETFVQAYMSLHTYQGQAPLEHWLTRIATRTGYRFWKQQQKYQHSPLLDEERDRLVHSGDDEVRAAEAAEVVHVLLGQLKPRDRLVLTLRYLEQCDVTETAQRTGWTTTMVKVQTHRAKGKLKKLLEKADIEFEL
ncbi:MAG: RNA polymerase sigma factor [Planctomycetota bacterium]|jgi:RNA polymerase sigma-70 factor (ECF subfamily)